jgi:hypothetical protein
MRDRGDRKRHPPAHRARKDHRRDDVRTVVKAVEKIEHERERDQD